MEKPIVIKREETEPAEEAIINAEIITNLEIASLVPEKTIEVSCSSSPNSYNEYFDVMLRKTFGYAKTVEKANETLKLFQERTMSRFVCYKVQSGFGRDDWCAQKHKILWHQDEQRIKTENYTPMYDGIPYILLGSKLLECQYGIDRNVYQKQKHYSKRNVERLKIKDRRLPVSKKVNCPAKIVMKDIIKFPLFKVDKHNVSSRRRKSMLLRWALEKCRAEGERRIYIQLPDDADHCNHKQMLDTRRPRRPRKVIKSEPTLLVLDASLEDPAFLQTFRVTKDLYQFLVREWQKADVEWLVKAEAEVSGLEYYEHHILVALYHLGYTESVSTAAARFKIQTTEYMKSVSAFCDFLISQEDKYLSLPSPEERITIAEAIKQESGFPGAFGAMDAALLHMQTLGRTGTGLKEEEKEGKEARDHLLPQRPGMSKGSQCSALVLQFITDHRLIFRNIHIDAPGTGTRIQIFQKSGAWFNLQNLTSAETHIVAPEVYPLAPAIMTPHTADDLSYQEMLYNTNHRETLKLAASTLGIYKSRFRRLQLLGSHIQLNRKIVRAACILHNLTLLHEPNTVLDDLMLNYNCEGDREGWHEGVEEGVAEFGILGGEEKRHYLTTVITPSLSYDNLSPHPDN